MPEGGNINRLGDVIVHARGKGILFVFFESVCSHRDNRNRFTIRRIQCANFSRGRVTIHHGHLNVHQNQIVTAIFLRNFFDGDFSIFITGSNSYLLSGELVTKLTGRYIAFELYPLSFDEYEEMKQFYHKAIDPDRLQELSQYILEGGFPRAIGFAELADKRTYVQGIIQEIFEKDIRRRVKIRDRQSFETVRNFIINNFGATTSISSLHDSLRKNGLEISRQTIARYIQILEDAKILYCCDRFDMKSKRALSGEKKYYLADLSFYFALNTDNRINYGPALENIVFIYARSMGYAVSIGRIGALECDFILRGGDMQYAYVQVALTILSSRKTEDREYRPLEMIRDNYPKYVATSDAFLQQRNGIQHINIIDFMKKQRRF